MFLRFKETQKQPNLHFSSLSRLLHPYQLSSYLSGLIRHRATKLANYGINYLHFWVFWWFESHKKYLSLKKVPKFLPFCLPNQLRDYLSGLFQHKVIKVCLLLKYLAILWKVVFWWLKFKKWHFWFYNVRWKWLFFWIFQYFCNFVIHVSFRAIILPNQYNTRTFLSRKWQNGPKLFDKRFFSVVL